MSQPPVCTLPILILAAGQSKRMRGRDKLMEEVDGTPLIRRQAEIARAASTGQVYVTLPVAPHPRHAALAGLPVTRIEVPDAADGMSASFRRGLRALPAWAEAVMILLADLPEITADDLRTVYAAVDLASDTLIWRGATADGAPGHPIVVTRALFDEFASLSGDSGGGEIVSRHKDRMVLIPLSGRRARLDLDTPEDWAAWRAKTTPRA